jgi:hypothetical protein
VALTPRKPGTQPGGGVTRGTDAKPGSVGGLALPKIPTIPGFGGVTGAGTATGDSTGTTSGSTPGYLPPEITDLKIEGQALSELTNLASDYERQRKDVEAGRSREAEVFNEGLSGDMERQVAAAKEQAAQEGRPFDEAAVRAELSRGQNKAKAEFALGTQKEALAATREGLGVAKAPFEAELASKGLSMETQKLVMDYALGRGGLANDAEKNQIMKSGQAMDGYKIMLDYLARAAGM